MSNIIAWLKKDWAGRSHVGEGVRTIYDEIIFIILNATISISLFLLGGIFFANYIEL